MMRTSARGIRDRSSSAMEPAGAANDCVHAPRWSVDSAYGPVTSTRRGSRSGSVPSLFRRTMARAAAERTSRRASPVGSIRSRDSSTYGSSKSPRASFNRRTRATASSTRAESKRPGASSAAGRSEGAPPISTSRPAAYASRTASARSAATPWGIRLRTPSASPTTTPSNPHSLFRTLVSSLRLACIGTPATVLNDAITEAAPSSTAARNGSRCTLRSRGSEASAVS